MKKSNFKPGQYNKLNNVRSKIINDPNISNILFNKKILDIGCGTGNFSFEIAKKNKTAFIKGIDIVESYVEVANINNKYNSVVFEKKDFINVINKYDVAVMFLGMTELLKKYPLEELLTMISKILCDNGHIIICDEFENDYSAEKDVLGIDIMKDIGYKFLNTDEFNKTVEKSDFKIVYTNIIKTNTQTTNFCGSKIKIFYEYKLNEFDGTKSKTAAEIWNKHKNEIIKCRGFRTNNKIRIFVLQKKDTTLINNDVETPTLLFDLDKLKENILYYKDLPEVKFLFPVKAFPHSRVLDVFAKNNFGFDVSNNNEYALVKKYKKSSIMYSDPTEKLKYKNSIRINIYDKNIKSRFGSEIDNNNYEIVHIHVSELKNTKVLNSVLKAIKKINLEETKYINIGGGYDNLSYQELRRFILSIKKEIPNRTQIILEPGSMWFSGCGYLVTKVEAINNLRGNKYLVLDSSKELHAKWSLPEIYSIYPEVIGAKTNFVFCGSTCYEKDVFCVYTSSIEIRKNTVIIFKNIEPYSYSWNSEFNGVKKAKVVFNEHSK